ncbi:hypothetical protein GQ457_04G028520 [Hibiscus cannabinus]
MSSFWHELFKNLGVSINASTAYHPEIDGQTERVNKCLETYLRCIVGEKPKEWGKWIHLAEWWYNSSFHSTIQTTPYQALYGQEPVIHLPCLAGESKVASADRSLQQREARAIKMLEFHLKRAQDRMKSHADKRRIECELTMGEWVYLKLQPYRQHSLRNRGCQKLAPKWYDPYQIKARVGKVAYESLLHEGSRVHPMFHVSQLKKHIGSAEFQYELPVIGPDGGISKEPWRVIDRRIERRGQRAVIEVLVKWTNSFPEDATWEVLNQLKMQFPKYNP